MCDDIVSPADLRVFSEVTRESCITGVKVAAHITAITTSLASLGSALKDVDTSVVDILNGWSWLEEHVNGQVPVLREAL